MVKKISYMNINQDISRISDIDELIEKCLDELIAHTGASGAYIITDHDGSLKIRTGKAVKDDVHNRYSMEIINVVYSTGQPLFTSDASTDERLREFETVKKYGIKSVICVPIKTRERVMGAVYLDNLIETGIFRKKEMDFVTGFLSHAGLAVENFFLRRQIGEDEVRQQPRFSTELFEEKITKAIVYIEEHYRSDISREGLAASLDINSDYFSRAFKAYTGKRMGDYINELRILEASVLIRETETTILDIALLVGFESIRTFNRSFQKIIGVNPSQYRKNNVL